MTYIYCSTFVLLLIHMNDRVVSIHYSLSNPSTITPPIEAGKERIIILLKAINGSSNKGILLRANKITNTTIKVTL